MNPNDLIQLGVPEGEALQLATSHMHRLFAQGLDRAQVEAEIFELVANPSAYLGDDIRGPLARALYRPPYTPRADLAPWRQWGEGLEKDAVRQMAHRFGDAVVQRITGRRGIFSSRIAFYTGSARSKRSDIVVVDCDGRNARRVSSAET